MKPQEWRAKLGECVRDLFQSPEMAHFYSIPMTRKRGQIYLLQLSLYVRQRRNFWPQVAANCPEFDVKQRILEHEHEELVEDEAVVLVLGERAGVLHALRTLCGQSGEGASRSGSGS